MILSYMLMVGLVPQAPNLYTAAVSAIGMVVSTLSVVLILMYLWTRPPIQQTMVQPVLTLTAVGSIFNMWKETLICLLGNCAPAFFQYILDNYPLWLCGFLNNHLNFGVMVYSLVILGISKLVLLIRPMDYHSANHDQIVRYIFFGLTIVLIVDNLLYFVLSNKYYCHSGTILRVVAIYNRSINVTLIKGQTVHFIFGLWDLSIMVSLIIIEIAILTGTLYKTKKNAIMRPINYLKQWNRVQTRPPITSQPHQIHEQLLNITGLIHMYPADSRHLPQINNFTGGHISTLHQPPNNVSTENQQDSSWSDLSNRRVLLLGALKVGLIFLQRKGVYGSTFLCNMYTRLLDYSLPVVWVTSKSNMRAYALGVLARLKSRFTNEDL